MERELERSIEHLATACRNEKNSAPQVMNLSQAALNLANTLLTVREVKAFDRKSEQSQ